MKENILEVQQHSNPQSITVEDIQDWLAAQVAEQLGVDLDEIDPKIPFDRYGLDSVQTMSIANLGKQHLRLEISPLVLWNYPNLESLSQYLIEQLETLELESFEI